MKYTTLMASAAAAVILAACGGGEPPATAQDTPPAAAETPASAPADAAAEAIAATLADAPAGTYALDRNHAALAFHVGHSTGLSQYRVGFANYGANLQFNPEDPASSQISVTINPAELLVDYTGDYTATHANSGFETWHDDLAFNDRWLNADTHPEITFTSTSAERTGPNTGTVTGDLTFLGQTRPVTLDVTYNGFASPPWNAGMSIIGFDAQTTIRRSEWGMDALIPWIGDEVTITFSGEFNQQASE